MTNTEYMRAWRSARGKPTRPDLWGSRVHVDVDALRHHMRPLTVHQLSARSGVHFTTLYALMRNGVCKDTTLDKVACALGLHMSELEALSPSDQERTVL